MKASSIIIAGLLIGACSSASQERQNTLDERNERVQNERSSAHRYDESPSVPGTTAGMPGPINHDTARDRHHNNPAADRDHDNVADADELNTGEAADNTGRNQRDRNAPTLTPGDQSNTSSDIEITQQIRKKVMDNDELSFNAKNVKIITIGGKVTLRGPVETRAESSAIESSARGVAGVAKVNNELEVKH